MDKLNLVNSEVSKEEKNYLYNLGVEKCQVGDYASAKSIFQFLYILESENVLYVKALAGSLHGMGNYAEANFFYNCAYHAQSCRINYDCLFYSANCLLKIGQPEIAKLNLQQFLDLCDSDQVAASNYAKMVKKCQLLLKGLG